MYFWLTWHDFATRHFRLLNVALAVLAAASALVLPRVRFSADWLELFAPDDPVVTDYRAAGAHEGSQLDLFVEIPAAQLPAAGSLMSDMEGLAASRPLPAAAPGAPAELVWLHLRMAADSAKDRRARLAFVERLRARFAAAGIAAGITGAEPVLQEFTASVQRDFVRTSLLSVAAVAAVVFLGFGLTPAVLLGFAYEIAGLLVAMAVFHLAGGTFNMLAATVPCVLVGLGIDFVIHIQAAAGTVAPDAGAEPTGKAVYRLVGLPMACGALTTAGAFFSLCLSALPGMRGLGVAGALGIVFMFLAVLLMLPPAISRLPRRPARLPRIFWMPASWRRERLLGCGVLVIYLALSAFAFHARQETRFEKLYDPRQPSMILQNRLMAVMQVHPSAMFVCFRGTPDMALAALAAPNDEFVADPAGVQAVGGGQVVVRLLPRQNPFEQANFSRLEKRLRSSLAAAGGSEIRLAGDAVLAHHLNRLLVRGALAATLATYVLLAVVLLTMFRRTREVLAPLLILTLVVAATLGCLTLLGVRMSAYTLVLLPLFIGIGIDDCLHVICTLCHGPGPDAGRGVLAARPQVVQAVTFTTLSTVAGYGSLVTAGNAGFVAMGIAAAVGLTFMLAGALYLLPPALSGRRGMSV